MSDINGRQFHTTLTFLENCNYNESFFTKDIVLPLQEADVTLSTPVLVSNDGNREPTDIYYNDQVKVTATIKYQNENVQNGVVNFYFIEKDDHTQTKQLINTAPLDVDINGQASIIFIPPSDGSFIAEYNGEPYYAVSESMLTNVHLKQIPTQISFTQKPPYFVKPEDDVQLSVRVINDVTKEPIDYGIVTFLYYDHFEGVNNVERVIGNPTYLDTNGISSINYVPIQDTDQHFYDSDYNIQLIRACYNYDNDLYGVNWKYYDMCDNYTAISMLKPNNFNIDVKKGDGTDLDINDNGMFTATNIDSINIICQLTDQDNHVVNFTAEDYVTIHLYGGDNGERTEKAYFDTNKHAFVKTITNFEKGIYTFYATSEHLNISNGYIVNENGNHVQIQYYDQDTQQTNNIDLQDYTSYLNKETQHVYIQINLVEADYSLELTTTKDTLVDTTTISKNSLKLQVKDIDAIDVAILNNKKCYFYSPTLEKTFEGKITASNINNVYGTPNSDITLPRVDDYVFYAYIQDSTLTKDSYSRQYTKTYSNTITIKMRTSPTLSLSIYNDINTYPGQIKYNVECTNIYHDNINVKVTVNRYDTNGILQESMTNLTKDFVFTPLSTRTFDILSKLPGDSVYKIKAQIMNSDFNHIFTEQISEPITKGNLIGSINNLSKTKTCTRQADLIFGLQQENNNEVININKNNINITVNEKNSNDIQTLSTNVISIEQINNKYVSVRATANLCNIGDWETKLEYTADTNYNALTQTTPFDITVTGYPAQIDFATDVYLNIYGSVISETSQYHNNEYLLIISDFTDTNNTLRFVNITDNKGKYTITVPNDINTATWQTYNNITYNIDPHQAIINIFKDSATNINNVATKFNSFFSDVYVQCSTQDIKNLYSQFISNNKKSLFVGYEQTTGTIKQNEIVNFRYGDD